MPVTTGVKKKIDFTRNFFKQNARLTGQVGANRRVIPLRYLSELCHAGRLFPYDVENALLKVSEGAPLRETNESIHSTRLRQSLEVCTLHMASQLPHDLVL
jgi:hypothetical protein